MSAPRKPARDPLFLQKALPYLVEFPVLGIPVRFATNDRAILSQVNEVFGHWRGAAGGATPKSKGIDIRLFLQEGDEGPEAEPLIWFRAPDPLRWVAHTPGSLALADLERGVGVAYVTRTLVSDRVRFQVSILNFLVFIILTIDDRTPVHAAVIGSGDAAVLLAGGSGSGKSTLAYAARQAGLDVLSDDAAYIQLEPRRVWGSGSSLLLLKEVTARFPELEGEPTALFPTGKRKMIVPASNGARGKGWVSQAGVCLLERSRGPVKLERIKGDEIRAMLTYDPAHAGVRFGARLADAAEWLAGKGGWKLTLSENPREAIPFIEEILREVGGS